jgi:hypothetical protein
MAKKFFWLGLVLAIVSLVFPFYGESQQVTQNQTVITVTRDPYLIIPLTKGMEIYIDGHQHQTPGRKPKPIYVNRGESIQIPIYPGTHNIYVQIGFFRSEVIHFAVDHTTPLTFNASSTDNEGLVLTMINLNDLRNN